MIELDLKKRQVKGNWFNAVHDRAAWRKIVHGDTAGLVIRAQRKKVEEKESQRKFIEKVGLTCPKCGKEYHSNKGGWFKKHVESCVGDGGDMVESVVIAPVAIAPVAILESDGDRVDLKCPNCGKQYRSNAGGWFKKHVDKCGPSQPSCG